MRYLITSFFALMLLLKLTIAVSAPNFSYDRQLAIELAKAYVRYELRLDRKNDVGEINFHRPFIKAATDSAGRNFVFVGFSSSKNTWGAYATFQVCESTPLLLPNDASTVKPFQAYWNDTDKVSPKVYVALPDICPKDEN